MTRARWLLFLLLFVVAATSAAGGAYYQFDSRDQEGRFHQLTNELRCLVCQGQSIADSNADLAKDMREKVHEFILAGRSDQEILGFMTARYGDFVLFRPPVKSATWLLWFAPALLGLTAVSAALVVARRRRSAGHLTPLSSEERDRLRRLLDDGEDRA